METFRREILHTAELAQAQVSTLRLKILKVGAVVIRNTRRINLLISSHYPYPKESCAIRHLRLAYPQI